MIKKLKTRFIILSMCSLLALLIVIVAGMNIINYHSVINNADEVLELLSKNKGVFPEEPNGKANNKAKYDISPELPYESRFFSVVINENDVVLNTDMSRIKSVDTDEAIKMAELASSKKGAKGFVENFRYVISDEFGNTRITFLDCGRKLDAFDNFLLASIFMALAGLVIIFFVICFFSGRIIKPIAESYDKQKQFITDAGHEIKTPLTIINANVDLLELEMGENESLNDIQQQTKRLTRLTNDLVFLSRMEENNTSLCMIEFPVSELVLDTVLSFKSLAQAKNKNLMWDIEPMLSLNGNAKSIEQLVTILLDNALKYSGDGSQIIVRMKKQNRSILLSVFNETNFDVNQDGLRHIFDRFYRNDESRNSSTGGHGIGLSIAKAIVNAHDGKIYAETRDGKSFVINVILPIKSDKNVLSESSK